jgi:hypothetical protein
MVVMLDNVPGPDDIIIIVFMLMHDFIFVNNVMLVLDEMLMFNHFPIRSAIIKFPVYRLTIIKITIIDEIIIFESIAASITTHVFCPLFSVNIMYAGFCKNVSIFASGYFQAILQLNSVILRD